MNLLAEVGMKKRALICIAFLLALLVCSCALDNGENSKKSSTSFAMGAVVTQTVYGGDEEILNDAIKAIKALDMEISYRKDNSQLADLNKDKTLTPSEKVFELISQSVKLSEETRGKYDITVLKLVKLWGFDGDSPSLPSEEDINKALENTGYENIKIEGKTVSLTGGVEIDLSAAGKGEACEVAVNEYKKAGISGAVVTVGGSVGVYGSKNGEKFTIGIRNPFDTASLIGKIKTTDTFISTSGSYEKNFEKDGMVYHHLLDPDTGYPVFNNLISVTVVCDDGGLSDMLASAFFCMGIDNSIPLLEEYSAEVVFITTDKQIYITKGLADSFESTNKYTVITDENPAD
jgi:thiamine biosynthesis lipoprotein